MATIAVRTTVLDGLNAQRRYLLNYVLNALSLGEPAVYTDGTNTWYVWDDSRIDLDSIATLGAVSANWNMIPAGYDPSTDLPATIRQKVKSYVASKIVQHQPGEDEPDPFVAVMAAQNAPAAVKAFSAVPPTWTPA